ncbi:hypothetical protein GCM10010238_04780 [Streptomyces griseoviridis]|uniref:Uncharacterized protein n=1 Tax=Streptomyces griseoviridis TaxID=45398 RepID=A0A918G4T1_STRGD|nr:hypothetical protein GCM10010238_04780 [Streptomyces niveoruber]
MVTIRLPGVGGAWYPVRLHARIHMKAKGNVMKECAVPPARSVGAAPAAQEAPGHTVETFDHAR